MPFWTLLEYFSRAVLNMWTQCFIIVTLEWTLLRQVRAKLWFPFSTYSVMSSLWIHLLQLQIELWRDCNWCFSCQQRQENYILCCDGYYSYWVITVLIREVVLLCSAVGIICSYPIIFSVGGRTTGDWGTGKALAGSGPGVIEILSGIWFQKRRRIMKNVSQDNRYRLPNLKRTSPE